LYFRFNNEPLALELTKKKFGLLLIPSQFNILVCLLVAQMLREGLMYLLPMTGFQFGCQFGCQFDFLLV
jgi:hypothetical protein